MKIDSMVYVLVLLSDMSIDDVIVFQTNELRQAWIDEWIAHNPDQKEGRDYVCSDNNAEFNQVYECYYDCVICKTKVLR